MNMTNKIKKGAALLLAFALLFSPFALQKLYAAGPVDTGKECALAFELESMETKYAELNSMEVPIQAYLVADIKPDGSYQAKAGYENLNLSSEAGSKTTAQWQEEADKAAEAAKGKAADYTIALHADSTANAITGLPAGMYLVIAEDVQSEKYEYSFAPYLVSLPNNYYDEAAGTSDEWVYEVTSMLKPDPKERYGDLEISKTLTSYNATLGTACFVFQIEAEKDGTKVYSDTVSINFDAPGVKTLTIPDIPAGAAVTVTEVYSGASYTASANVQKTVIAAEDVVTAAFENTYDHRLNSGTGIVNHFTYSDGTWNHEQQSDSTGNTQ